ncbi:MAG: hypothetical protein ABI718_18450 [Acidobacteriota bacterium]
MRIGHFAAVVMCVVPILSCGANRAAGVSIDSRLNKEFDRVEQSLHQLESTKLPEGLQGLLKTHQASFNEAKNAKSPLLRLYRLRNSDIGVTALQFLTTQKAAGENVASLESLWKTRQPAFDGAERDMPGPAVLVALRQAAGNRARKFFYASLPYGKTASPSSGLYYFAEAEGNLRFRGFVESLLAGQESEQSRPPGAETLAQALEHLETRTLQAFEDDPVVPATIPVSSRLKETRELLDQNEIEGATLALLESQLEFSRQTKNVSADPAATGEVKPAESSLGELISAMAREDEPQTARIIRNDVQPLYASLFVATTAANKTKSAPVTVTLVRWPYT